MAYSLADFQGEVIYLDTNGSRIISNITRSRSQYLRDHSDVVRVLMEQIDPLVEAICDLVTLESVTAADIGQMRQEMQASGILPRDAIHLAVMKRLGLTAVASDDAGFDTLQDITLFQP